MSNTGRSTLPPPADSLQFPKRRNAFHSFPLVGARRSRPRPPLTGSSYIADYAANTSLHGIKYVFRDDASLLQRMVWAAMILFSVFLTVALCLSMVLKYDNQPSSTLVKDTHYPLYVFPFPAVTVCPTEKIKRLTAFSYIHSNLNLSMDESMTNSINNFLNAMALFKHPHYRRMLQYLNRCEDLLPLLANLNLTDFMLQVLPTCEEVFAHCSWHGLTENCCDIFSIQRSEEGFCYSFNSVTSQSHDRCPHHSYNSKTDPSQCELRRNPTSGPTTGMQVFLRHFDPDQYLVNWSTVTGESGVKVQLHTSDEYPEAGMGVLVPAKAGMKMTTTIKAYITQSMPAIRALPLEERNCYFPDEMALGVAAQYSQRSCLIECRLDYLHTVCGCRPYYFNMIDNSIPICNSTQLKCIAEYGSNVKFYNPPPDAYSLGFTSNETSHALNCSRCLPTCHESYYDDDADLTSDTQQRALETFGYLDLYYKYGGAVYYQRDVDFGLVDLLVSVGGVAGLFLGVSVLTLCEIVYLLATLIFHTISRRESATLTNPSLPKGLIYNKDFFNK